MTAERPLDDDALLAESRRARRELPDAPEWLVLRAEAIGEGVARRPAAPSLRQRLQALLSLDQWAAAPALRSAAAGERQLLFTTDQGDVDLRLVPTGATWSVRGQVLAPDEGGEVEVAGPPPMPPVRRTLDAMGGFDIAGLAPGDYRITLSLTGCDIELPALSLPDPAAHG